MKATIKAAPLLLPVLLGLALLLTATGRAAASFNDDHALAFFFRSDCPFCHQFAPVLKQFGEENKFFIYPFSLDGAGLPPFSQPLRATPAITSLFSPRVVPATYLVNVHNRRFIRIAEGMVRAEDLQKTLEQIKNDKALLARLDAESDEGAGI